MSAAEIADLLGTTQRAVVRWRNGHYHPISRKGRTMTDTIDALLAEANRHPVKRIKTAAAKANAAVQRVRDLIAEDAGNAEARERVEQLQRELAEAKAALRKPRANASVTAIDSKAVRAWASANNVVCPATGRVPNSVIAAYDAAHTKAS